ncbi:hypothetical protein DFO66_101328 [Brevibacterium sanguinis]|uniref:Uncharacterized protein n=2 Tax=Brevibacterium TaxID=1696 RepID=A0A366IPN9_9MICO|nr:hypothetical protein DFO66_101328 [Brevibacterium sanguinis]RBP74482.1 hypothetical protein DFO65_101201 [Brevibacterium celere]
MTGAREMFEGHSTFRATCMSWKFEALSKR